MNRNVTIVIIILILVVIAGYLVWLRNQYQPPVAPRAEVVPQEVQATPSPMPILETATPSATPKNTKTKTATPSATKR